MRCAQVESPLYPFRRAAVRGSAGKVTPMDDAMGDVALEAEPVEGCRRRRGPSWPPLQAKRELGLSTEGAGDYRGGAIFESKMARSVGP